MGCICSKGLKEEDDVSSNDQKEKANEYSWQKHFSVQLIAPAPLSSKKEEVTVDVSWKNGSVRHGSNPNNNTTTFLEGEKKLGDKPTNGHQQRRTTDLNSSGEQQRMTSKVTAMPNGAKMELIVAGWPQWLAAVAGEAIKGWLPRPVDSFEKLEKIGQGTYSSVYRARDLETGKIVAMKKVRFVNMDPESVRFMAREIHILRRLNHPNVMKLESIVTSRMSGTLYLVFEYMEHDLAGLAATPGVKFTEPQIKCYMQQLLCGLEYCHSRGVLHRDIKGSNLLIDNNGVLKIGDFGLATFYQPGKNQALTSRVVTLWYRAPELLLGATEYGVAIDMWSTGCILAELFAGKPIMSGRTEVEQMHKIFKLCGSPSEDYWQKTKLPHATSFKPQQSYQRCVTETFKYFPSSALSLVDTLLSMEPESRGSTTSALSSEFFKTQPLPCDPSSLPKYPPCKELDAKIREEEARRRRAEAVKGHEAVRRGSGTVAPKTSSTSYNYDLREDIGSGFRIEPSNGATQNGFIHSSSMIHPRAVGPLLTKNRSSAGSNTEIRIRKSHSRHGLGNMTSSHKKDERASTKDTSVGYVQRKNRIHCSGPLMPPGGNIEDMLKEHERQIQQAVRKARLEKSGTKDKLDAQPYHNRR